MLYRKSYSHFSVTKKRALAMVFIITIMAFLFLLIRFIGGHRTIVGAEKLDGTEASTVKAAHVIRAREGVKAGSFIDSTSFELIEIPRNLLPENAVLDFGEARESRVKRGMEKNEFLVRSNLIPSRAWYSEGDRLIEHCFTEGAIPASVDSGSTVDIRLFKPDGKDPLVISKASVVKRSSNTLTFYLNDMEQEYLKQAAYEGAIFLVKYLDDAQPASLIDYVPTYAKFNQ